MNKRALVLKLLFIFLVVGIIFLSLSAYIKFNKNNVKITTGNIIITVDYNNTESKSDTISPPSNLPNANQTNFSPENLTRTNQTNASQ
ncbi:hypothetical protein J4402_01205 [Candidatus Pacearchaeota archaeon]|nr:hypothetical protein [Candidatus Pacearchaeota archaeon]